MYKPVFEVRVIFEMGYSRDFRVDWVFGNSKLHSKKKGVKICDSGPGRAGLGQLSSRARMCHCNLLHL